MTQNPVETDKEIRIKHLEMRGIVKRFPGVLANNWVNFDVKSGEVHTLLGENGAGKSTLMKILYGLYQQDEGDIIINGETVQIQSPNDAIQLGIGMVHQHFMLIPTLTVAENVALGLRSSREPLMDLDQVSARINQLSEIYGLQVNPNDYVWQLAVGEQQRVEIIKTLYRDVSLLILDEPTAVLTPQEVTQLFETLHQMTADGHALIFISHKLHEVLAISDRITVLRDGSLVGSIPTADATRSKLAQMMVGREVVHIRQITELEFGDNRLVLRNISAMSDRKTPALSDVNLEVRAGEILGIAGVSGNGQRELAEVISGLRPLTSGEIILDGTDVVGWNVKSLREAGLAFIPEERMRDGAIKEFTVEENLILQVHDSEPFSHGIFLDFRAIAEHSQRLIANFNVKTPSQDTTLKSLSGGNIQKLIMARELSRDPNVLIASQPTRGVDIGAIEYIHQRLLDQRTKGTATLLISEDLDEILALSDRIAVIYEGEIVGISQRGQATIEELGLMMAGVRPK